ncbi:DUF805 domain-containing protein [Litorimonas sp. WD9-15]|uniref:DUF805 domain-containing protein n=1 Tax=Litorimonas sp. WD9-15 TaxID=3418716 RepID=UPI003D07E201
MLDFGEAVRRYYTNYFNPQGRSQRSAYWWVFLYQIIIYTVLAIVFFMADGAMNFLDVMVSETDSAEEVEAALASLGVSGKAAIFFIIIFAVSNFLPDIMLQIRRFHDLNQTGWLVLAFRFAGLLPLVGSFIGLANLVWFCIPGTVGGNRYGPDPLRQETDIF